MICIFCLNNREPGNEHVFPRAIGGALKIDRVCEDKTPGVRSCNSVLGAKVDVFITDHPLVIIHRARLGLAGNSGKIPDAVQSLLGSVASLESDTSQKMRLFRKMGNEQLEVEFLYNKKVTELPDGSFNYEIIIDARGGAREAEKVLRRELSRLKKRFPNQSTLSDAQITVAVAEMVNNARSLDGVTLKHSIDIDIQNYKIGILKIVYELAFLWFGEEYLDDPLAWIFRSVLNGKEEIGRALIPGAMFIGSAHPTLQPWWKDRDAHIAFSFITNNKISIAIKIFDVFSGVIIISDNASKYVKSKDVLEHCKFLHINAANKTFKETFLLDEFSRVAVDI